MISKRLTAIVLRRTNYGEADRIVQFITPQGRQTGIAKGARREKSKLAGGIELFAVSDIVLHRGKGDMGVITSARLIQFYRHILEDYDRMQFGYEAIKQVGKASETLDEPEWFDLLKDTLAGLDQLMWPRQLVEIWFYLRFAALLGYELSFTHDIAGQTLQVNKKYQYDVSEKGLRLVENGALTADHIKFLRIVGAKPLRAVTQIGGVETILAECWLVARQHAAI